MEVRCLGELMAGERKRIAGLLEDKKRVNGSDEIALLGLGMDMLGQMACAVLNNY